MDSGPIVQSRSRWKLYLTLLTFGLLAVLIYGLREDIGGVIKNLGKVNAFALLLLIPIEFWNYDAYARLLRSLFATLGHKVAYWPMFKYTLELNFVNHILPSGGVSGISYFSMRTKTLGISPAQSTLTQVTKLFMLYASFQPLSILGLIFLASQGHVNNFVILVATSLITAMLIGTGVAIYIIESQSRINTFLTFITRGINKLVHLFHRRNPEIIKIDKAQLLFKELHENYKIYKNNRRALIKPFFYTMLANATEVAAVYAVYIAFGEYVNLGAVILAYEVANFAGLLSIFPAGIGVYEGLMTGVLAAAGVPIELSIPVTIMYRVLMMVIQLTPGYYFYQRALKRGLTVQV